MADITIFANAALPLLLNMSSQVVYFKVTNTLTEKESSILLLNYLIYNVTDVTDHTDHTPLILTVLGEIK